MRSSARLHLSRIKWLDTVRIAFLFTRSARGFSQLLSLFYCSIVLLFYCSIVLLFYCSARSQNLLGPPLRLHRLWLCREWQESLWHFRCCRGPDVLFKNQAPTSRRRACWVFCVAQIITVVCMYGPLSCRWLLFHPVSESLLLLAPLTSSDSANGLLILALASPPPAASER